VGSNQSKKNDAVIAVKKPLVSSLRRGRIWASPWSGRLANIENISYHEAGHVVFFEYLDCGNISAEVSPTGGIARLLDIKPGGARPHDPDGSVAATVAAAFHAGLMAEILLNGVLWTGPIFYLRDKDYLDADFALLEVFGRHASGAHAFAQQLALHVLSLRWQRVQEVADTLISCGKFQSWTGDEEPLHCGGASFTPLPVAEICDSVTQETTMFVA
jgi:hypothetical protein